MIRFVLAAASGALLCYWALFLFVAGGMAGEIYWDGSNHGHFLPGYLASALCAALACDFLELPSFASPKERHVMIQITSRPVLPLEPNPA